MNRSFRAPEAQAAVIKPRQQLRASTLNHNNNNNNDNETEEEQLALFLEMKKSEEDQTNLLLLNAKPDDFDGPLGAKPGTSPIFNMSSSTTAPARKPTADDFLNSDNDKNDYDWLMTPPGTPLFPSLETGSQKTIMSQLGATKTCSPALKSRLANPQSEAATRSISVTKQSVSSPGLNSSGSRRPSSSGGPGSRPGTPTSRPTPPSTSKPSRSSTPTSRHILPSKPAHSASKTVTAVTKLMASAAKVIAPATKLTAPATKQTAPATKSMTPSTKQTAPATRQTISARSSTPTRSTPRSSTPTTRPSIPPSKSTSRASTPTRRPYTPASAPTAAVSSVKPSTSVTKPVSTTKNPVPSRGTSPTPKSRPWKPSDMPGFSLDTPPNLRTSVTERPISAARGRPGAPSSSFEPAANVRPRRQSCSPSRGRTSYGVMHTSGSSVPAINRLHAKANDNVSPVLMGAKMVERVINMRKLAPPRQDNKHSPHGNSSAKLSSPDSLGFGRTLSKKSLDMAIRHMDIRRSIPGNLRPLMTNIPASSMYSVRLGPTRSRTISVSDSPLATSSNASSEPSVNNGVCLDGIELEDEIGSERGGQSTHPRPGDC